MWLAIVVIFFGLPAFFLQVLDKKEKWYWVENILITLIIVSAIYYLTQM